MILMAAWGPSGRYQWPAITYAADRRVVAVARDPANAVVVVHSRHAQSWFN